MSDWTVNWRAIPIDGSTPDQYCSMTVSGDVAKTPAQAIHVAQTHRKHIIWERLPEHAFVDWECVEASIQLAQSGQMPAGLG